MSQIKIDEVVAKNSVYPMIVSFQNGYVTENFVKNECLLFENDKSNKKTIVTEIGDLLYAGEEQEEPLGKTMILARNKKTGKVRLIEVENIELTPVVKTKSEAAEVPETSNLELTRKFGSKKHKQMMEQREKLKINVQTVTEQMTNVTDSLIEDQLDLSLYNKSNADEFYIPPINREAKRPDEVYDLDQILPESLYEKIHSEIENSSYIDTLNEFLKPIGTRDLPPKHAVLLVYANSLLKLYATVMKEITKKSFVACPHSVTLNEVILKNFLSNIDGKRGRSPQYKDKSLCHAIVFILLINNYKFDFEELCQQLKLTQRTVTSKVALTGASIVTAGNKKIAQLKLPLNKPALRRKSGF